MTASAASQYDDDIDNLFSSNGEIYLCSLPNRGLDGHPKFLRTADHTLARRWIKAEDRPGFSVYYCPNPLKREAAKHGTESTAAIHKIIVDIDFKDVADRPEEIKKKLDSLMLTPSQVVDSGHGYHVEYWLKEGIDWDDPEFDAACQMQADLIDYFAGDPQVRPWSLLRVPGTTNSKQEPHVPCEIIFRGVPVDVTEVGDLASIATSDGPLLTRKEPDPEIQEEHAAERPPGAKVDAEAELAAMVPGQVNRTHCRVIPSLLREHHPDEVLEIVVNATIAMASKHGFTWSTSEEESLVRSRILSAYNNLLLKSYDPSTGEIPMWLPGEFHADWIERLKSGRSPAMAFNRSGFYVRSRQGPNGQAAYEGEPRPNEPEPETKTEAPGPPPRKIRFKLVPFQELKPGPEPLYLVDELIPVAGIVDVWGKAKCYKSFWTLDVMLHTAMGWEYRDRYVSQGAVVYCAFEGSHGYKKRVEALRRHYAIPPETSVPLYVMPGQANLIKDHRLLISDIKSQLGETCPAAVVLDTLNKSLYGSENKDVDMGDYIRAAEAVRDAFHCVVIIVHHCGYDDTRPRGHSSLPGAVDAQLSVTRSETIVTVTVEMMRDGPEDTVVVSEAKPVEVGQDQNGKPLTSLVLIASDADASTAKRSKWSRTLKSFCRAAKSALGAHGVSFQHEMGALPVRAVDLEMVREQFYRIFADGEKDKAKAQTTVQHAFRRGLNEADSKEIVRTVTDAANKTMVWFRERESA